MDTGKLFVKEVASFASQAHADVNHLRDGEPYSWHLQDTWIVAAAHYNKVDVGLPDYVVYAACWCHDLLEDTRLSYNDLTKGLYRIAKKHFTGPDTKIRKIVRDIVEIVYALTDEKGRTRKERKPPHYYKAIRETPGASFVKYCDRISNVIYASSCENERMCKVYLDEMEDFLKSVSIPGYAVIEDYLESLVKSD